MNVKAGMRAEMIARRDALAPAERARLARDLAERLVALPGYETARTVLSTMSIGSELDTRPFIERALADGKAVALPRVAGPQGVERGAGPAPKRLRLHLVKDLAADLAPGVWDIPEPNPAHCPEVMLPAVDFAWIPALAADRRGYRLGYGAGYFDKLLAGRGTRPFCVCALPASFVVESLPHEPHDVAVDLVLTSP